MSEKSGNEKTYLTLDGFKYLKTELHDLLTVQRPKWTEVVSWAASLGDRSENADYQYGKRKLREVDRRIHWLQGRLELAEVVTYVQGQEPKDVRFGAWLEVQVEGTDEQGTSIHIYRLVGPDEADPKKGYISWRSPVGRALLGRKLGDYISVEGLNKEFEILRVWYFE